MHDILDSGFDLTLRPMRYPHLYDMYKESLKNSWSVSEIDFSSDLVDLRENITLPEKHLINRLVAFFATGDTIVANNLVLNLYKHINSPEARIFLGKQLADECLHVDFYLTLLDNYLASDAERSEAFSAIENIPSIRRKGEFCFKWIDIASIDVLITDADKKRFILNLITFACAVEGLFFFAAFAYVFFLRSKGLLNGLADGTNWVFRDEAGVTSGHMSFGLAVIDIIRHENPHLFDRELGEKVADMMRDAVECESMFAADVLSEGVTGLSYDSMVEYLRYTADQRMKDLGLPVIYKVNRNPFSFMELQNVQGLANFFERTVTEYQTNVSGDVEFDSDF